ncbi:MAG: S1 RNA-binding domain-containing protein [Candidatus Falkowbacteria bacterium]
MSNAIVENSKMTELLDKKDGTPKLPEAGEIVKGTVIAIKRNQILVDIDGIAVGIVRGQELNTHSDEYKNLKVNDSVEATVLEGENELGFAELSFSYAGHQKVWNGLHELMQANSIVNVRVKDANKGGLLVTYGKLNGFLPVSQLSPEHYPRVPGGDKNKILERLKKLAGEELAVKIITADEDEEKLIVSEKAAWEETKKEIFSKYKEGDIIPGKVTAITNFGVFVEFGERLEGLIHISELAWQRIDDPNELFKVEQELQVKIIKIDNSKMFLSVKQLSANPWIGIEQKYKIGDIVEGTIAKVNPYGLFVQLDGELQGLAHVSELSDKEATPSDIAKAGDKMKFKIVSLEPNEYRMGLSLKGL